VERHLEFGMVEGDNLEEGIVAVGKGTCDNALSERKG
jgi:hypothetical protein